MDSPVLNSPRSKEVSAFAKKLPVPVGIVLR